MTEDKKEVQSETIVVEQIPQVAQREVESEDKKKYNLITKEEALTEILMIVRTLKKTLV